MNETAKPLLGRRLKFGDPEQIRAKRELEQQEPEPRTPANLQEERAKTPEGF